VDQAYADATEGPNVKKLLIAGGSHSDIPLINAAKSYGYHVITSGNREDDLGHRLSDQVCLQDFSNKEAILSLAQRLDIDAICSSANDFSLISCAYVAEQMGLPGFDSYETTLTLHHKDRFRALSSKLALPCPKAKSFATEDVAIADIADLPFPLIVKPIDLTGGKGISRIDSPDQLAAAVKLAFDFSRAKTIVIETFISGTLHSYSSFIRDRRVIFDYADNEHSFLNHYLVSTSTSPAIVDPSILPAIRSVTEHLAGQLNLVDGILHMQFLANGRDFNIIEYTRRCPGDFYAIPVQHSTGINHADMIVRPCLGMDLVAPTDFRQKGFFSRHCVMAERPGTILEIRITDEISGNIMETFPLRKPGEQIDNHLVDKAAIMFLRYASEDEMIDKNQRITSLIRVVTE
jgi:biotin carboxylase